MVPRNIVLYTCVKPCVLLDLRQLAETFRTVFALERSAVCTMYRLLMSQQPVFGSITFPAGFTVISHF